MVKKSSNLFADFRPYQWYDSKVFPSSMISRSERSPLCDILVKWWDPNTDTFKMRKIGATYYQANFYFNDEETRDKVGWQGLRSNERVFAWMHDGQDVSYEEQPLEEAPALRERPISKEFGTITYQRNRDGQILSQVPLDEDRLLPEIGMRIEFEDEQLYKVVGVNTLDQRNPIIYMTPLNIREGNND